MNVVVRFFTNSAQIRQSRPDSGLGFQVKVRKTCLAVPSRLDSGWYATRLRRRCHHPLARPGLIQGTT